MDVLTLVAEARRAGLTLVPEGDQLRVRGPRVAQPIAQRVLARKAEVLEVLRLRAVYDELTPQERQRFEAEAAAGDPLACVVRALLEQTPAMGTA